ncbi:lysophospholipid acyltransferase family protein [Sediminihaliea albiluteola]|uniref:lysophospholipid acyltransferase family protein n=1 Tax=Sediminihaliea albiluteola TaxID=2758564 RepID=UPI002E2CE8DC|nr:lysophospholipid acyltransferase family protein [Sediminihaliea albiluteola]
MILYRLISRLPFPLLYALAWLAYLLLYYVVGYRKSVVKQNLSRAFPEKSSTEISALSKQFYRRFTQVALEIVKARRMTEADFAERMVVRNPEFIEQLTENFTRSAIILTVHQGNWEWMLHGASTSLGIPIDPVYKPLHNPTTDRLIYDIRRRFGGRPLAMADAARDILRRRREFRLFVMVADQSPIRNERGYWSSFMNQEAAFYLGAESIAQMTQFPVAFVQCHRVRTGYYEMEFHHLASPPYEKGSHNIIDAYIKAAEAAIRNEPESWLWSNRRWKRDRAKEEARSNKS